MALAAGDLVRHYRIVRLIAHGGVASTFEVEDARSGQETATIEAWIGSK
jgi:hypothetical protein